jgi:hypothetical protein
MSYQTTQQNEKVLANQSQQTQIRDVHTRTIDQIRTQGLEPSTLEKIQHDKAEMDRLEKQNADRLKGNYISFKDDKETKTLLFTGKYQKVDVPMKDFATGKIIEGKTVAKWRFECYDTSNPNNISEVSVWERGYREAKVVMHFLGESKTELVVMRNGARGNSQTTYLIYPTSAPITPQLNKRQQQHNNEEREEPTEEEQNEPIANSAQRDYEASRRS